MSHVHPLRPQVLIAYSFLSRIPVRLGAQHFGGDGVENKHLRYRPAVISTYSLTSSMFSMDPSHNRSKGDRPSKAA